MLADDNKNGDAGGRLSMSRGRGRPPSPPPLIFWRLRLDVEPPRVCREHPELAKLLHWQIVLVRDLAGGEPGTTEPVTGIKAHILEDDDTKHRFLRSFGSAAQAIHGYLVMENEPPAGARAIVRVRGADLPVAAEISLDDAEKVNKLLHEQPADQLARAALERDDVRELLVKMLSQKKK